MRLHCLLLHVKAAINQTAAARRFFLLLVLLLSLTACPILPRAYASHQKRGYNVRRKTSEPIKARLKRRGTKRASSRGRRPGERMSLRLVERDGEFERPDERLDWFMFQRTYPATSPFLPNNLRLETLKKMRLQEFQLKTILPLGFAQPRWKPIGPLPIKSNIPSMSPTTGRLGAIAVSPTDPNLVLVGGAMGGIWLSTDAGNNFAPVADEQLDMAVETLAFSNSNPSVVYAGMGDATGGYMGSGVLKSTDGGQNWAKVSKSGLPIGTISHLIVDPFNPLLVYITEFNRRDEPFPSALRDGFRYSTDGGETWSDLKKVGFPKSLVMHPTQPKTLYLSMAASFPPDPPAAVYKSMDGGETWKPIFVPGFKKTVDLQLAVTPAEPDTLYLLSGGVFNPMSGCGIYEQMDFRLRVSKDGGENWKDLRSPDIDAGSFGRKTYIAVDPKNANVIYIGTRDVYKSIDGGKTWENLTKNWRSGNGQFDFDPMGWRFEPLGVGAGAHTDQHVYAFSPKDSNIIYIGNDGGLARSRDGGKSFESLNGTLPLAQLNSITAHPTSPDILYGGTQDNGALVRKGDTDEWREFIAGDSGGCVIDPRDSSIVMAHYVFGVINRFRNHGEIQEQPSIASSTTFGEDEQCPRIGFYPPFISDPLTGNLYFGTWRLFVSSDGGNTWSRAAKDKDKDLTKGKRPDVKPDVLTAIAVSTSQSGVIYTGSSQGQAMISKDGGKTWADITSGLVDRFIKSIVVSSTDPDTAYITFSGFNKGHVFKTTNGGAVWTDISGNLYDTPVNALLIDPADPNIIYVGTDVGVFRSTANGYDWQAFNSGLPSVVVNGFSVRSDRVIQIATFGRGAYELVR